MSWSNRPKWIQWRWKCIAIGWVGVHWDGNAKQTKWVIRLIANKKSSSVTVKTPFRAQWFCTILGCLSNRILLKFIDTENMVHHSDVLDLNLRVFNFPVCKKREWCKFIIVAQIQSEFTEFFFVEFAFVPTSKIWFAQRQSTVTNSYLVKVRSSKWLFALSICIQRYIRPIER